MAYAHDTRTFSHGLRLFNIDNAVGVNSNNLAGDVMLVQWFINKLRKHPIGLSGSQLDVDGDCGRETKKAIKETQQQLHDLGDAMSIDGRLDPFPFDFPKEAMYAFFRMQFRCDSLYGDQTWMIDPVLAPDSPPRLRFAIRGYWTPNDTHGGGV